MTQAALIDLIQVEQNASKLHDILANNQYVEPIDGNLLLHIACLKDHLEIVKVLIKHRNKLKIAINQPGTVGETPLYIACFLNHLEIVKFLISVKDEIGLDVNQECVFGKTPFFIACATGNLITVEFLLEQQKQIQLDVNRPDQEGKTPLYKACQLGRIEIALAILSKCNHMELNLRASLNNMLLACFSTDSKNSEEIQRMLRVAGCEESISSDNASNHMLINTQEIAMQDLILQSILKMRLALQPDYINQYSILNGTEIERDVETGAAMVQGSVARRKFDSRDQYTSERYLDFIIILQKAYDKLQSTDKYSNEEEMVYKKITKDKDFQSYVHEKSLATISELFALIYAILQQYHQNDLQNVAEQIIIKIKDCHDMPDNQLFYMILQAVRSHTAFVGLIDGDVVEASKIFAIQYNVISYEAVLSFIEQDLAASILFDINIQLSVKDVIWHQASGSALNYIRGAAKKYMIEEWVAFKEQYAPHISRQTPQVIDFYLIDLVLNNHFQYNPFIRVYQLIMDFSHMIHQQSVSAALEQLILSISEYNIKKQEIDNNIQSFLDNLLDRDLKDNKDFISAIKEAIVEFRKSGDQNYTLALQMFNKLFDGKSN